MTFTEIAVFSLIALIAIIAIIALLSIAILFIFWLWALVHCLKSGMTTSEKLFWLVVIILFNIPGALFYLIFSKLMGEKTVKSKNFRGKKLFRSKKDKMVAGVCAGIGEYLDIDPTVIRLLWVLFTIMSLGTGILAYVIAWIVIPEKER